MCEIVVQAPTALNNAEYDAFTRGGSPSLGIASVALISARTLIDMADAVAALSCSALGVNTKPFDSKKHDEDRCASLFFLDTSVMHIKKI